MAPDVRAAPVVEIWVHDEAYETMRELVRRRALARRDARPGRASRRALQRLNETAVDLLPAWTLASVIEALQALRGVSVPKSAV